MVLFTRTTWGTYFILLFNMILIREERSCNEKERRRKKEGEGRPSKKGVGGERRDKK